MLLYVSTQEARNQMRNHSPLSITLHEAAKQVADSGFTRGAWVVKGVDNEYHTSLDNAFKGILLCLVAFDNTNKISVVRW